MGIRLGVCALLLTIAGVFLVGWDRGTHPRLIDHRAPDFTVGSDGQSIELTKLEGRKILVLNFWASWCVTCVQEIPSLQTMQSELQDKVEVVAVSVDDDPDAYHHFLEERGIHFLTVRDPQWRASTLYGTKQIPESYIIDRRGVVQRKFVGPVDWTSPEVMAYLRGL